MMTEQPVLTTKDIARHYGVTPTRIRAIARDRGIKPALRIGRVYAYIPEQLEQFRPRATGRPGHRR